MYLFANIMLLLVKYVKQIVIFCFGVLTSNTKFCLKGTICGKGLFPTISTRYPSADTVSMLQTSQDRIQIESPVFIGYFPLELTSWSFGQM